MVAEKLAICNMERDRAGMVPDGAICVRVLYTFVARTIWYDNAFLGMSRQIQNPEAWRFW